MIIWSGKHFLENFYALEEGLNCKVLLNNNRTVEEEGNLQNPTVAVSSGRRAPYYSYASVVCDIVHKQEDPLKNSATPARHNA